MNTLLKTSFCFFLFVFSAVFTAVFTAKVQAEPTVEADPPQTEEQAVTPSDSDLQAQSKPKQYYIVEVVLFRHLNEQGKNAEYWSRPDPFNDFSLKKSSFNDNNPQFSTDTSAQTITDDMPALAQYDMQNKRFLPLRNGIAALSKSNYKLADSAAHIRYSPDFQLLAHFGWTQRSLSKKRALPVFLTSNQFSDSMTPAGELKLYVSRYLHMQVDLAATQCEYKTNSDSEQTSDKALDEQLENGTSQLETQASDATNNRYKNAAGYGQGNINPCVNNVYLFKQKRKMRSRELHYLDNPVFGMLVYITPFTI